MYTENITPATSATSTTGCWIWLGSATGAPQLPKAENRRGICTVAAITMKIRMALR